MRTPQNYVKNADTTEAYFNKSHLLRRVRFNKPKRLENSQLLRKTEFNLIELILEQCVANYYGDNTVAK